MRNITNFQTDLLRTFVSVIDLGAYTKAGDALGRTQPAISLQMRRLEELVGAPLIKQVGRTLLLTSEGEMLLSYAREILRLNDEAASYFNRAQDRRRAARRPAQRLCRRLPAGRHHRIHARSIPEISLEIYCGWSADILDRLRADELDLAVAMVNDERAQYLSRSWIERPIWAAAEARALRSCGRRSARRAPGRLRLSRAHDPGARHRANALAGRLYGARHFGIAERGHERPRRQRADPLHHAARHAGAGSRPTVFRRLPKSASACSTSIPRLSDAGIRLVNHIIARLDEAGVSGDPVRRQRRAAIGNKGCKCIYYEN